jgi:hypothetical protein
LLGAPVLNLSACIYFYRWQSSLTLCYAASQNLQLSKIMIEDSKFLMRQQRCRRLSIGAGFFAGSSLLIYCPVRVYRIEPLDFFNAVDATN